MIDDWFSSVELPIAFSEFVRLPRHPAYKYEYFGGRAVLTPRPSTRYAIVELDVLASESSPPTLLDGVVVHPLRTTGWAHLPELLVAAFRDVPPFGGLNEEAQLTAAREGLDHTMAGGDGRLLDEACFVAVDTSEQPEGAIVVTLRAPPVTAADQAVRPHLTWVMVSPWRFRQGLGSAMLRCAGTALRRLGYRELASTFLGGNERSAMWHWRNGFRLQPDPWSRRYRLAPEGDDA